MDNGTKALLGIISLILGFYIGRTSFPAAPASRYVIPLGGQVRIAQTPQPAPASAAPATAVSPPITYGSFPTPYPTPPLDFPPAAGTSPNLNSYSTPYPASSDRTTSGNQAVTTGGNSWGAYLQSIDWQSHILYIVIALLAIAMLARKHNNQMIYCLALITLGAMAGRYLEFGPIGWPKIAGVVLLRRIH